MKSYNKHGLSNTRMFRIWLQMKGRCNNKNDVGYKRYGGRGIKVCERWNDFINFYNDMKNGHDNTLTLDRIDVNGNYEPSNCRWATKKEQALNRRNTIYFYADGKKKGVMEVSEDTGLPPKTIRNRYFNGWSYDDLFTRIPSRGCRKKGTKLDTTTVLEIFKSDEPPKVISEIYSISTGFISNIKSGGRWASITRKEYKRKHKNQNL